MSADGRCCSFAVSFNPLASHPTAAAPNAQGYKVYLTPPPSTTVMWFSMVLGEFYQQMNLKHFPFDRWGRVGASKGRRCLRQKGGVLATPVGCFAGETVPTSSPSHPSRSFDLGIATEVLDTSEVPHPGLTFHLSSGGMQKYMCKPLASS